MCVWYVCVCVLRWKNEKIKRKTEKKNEFFYT